MLVPFPSSCFSFIWDCHLFLYSLSHPPRYLPQPCPGSHRFNYVLRTSRTVPVEILCMHLCRDVKYPGLGAIHSRIKCSPSSLLSTSLPHRREPYARGQSRTHFFFLASDIWGTKWHSYFSYEDSLLFFLTISSLTSPRFFNGEFSAVD